MIYKIKCFPIFTIIPNTYIFYQTVKSPDEKIKAIYDKFQERSELFEKIKWKDSFKKVLGIESPKETGMDI